MRKLLFTALGAASMAAVVQAQDTVLWDDQNPAGGTMNLSAGVFDSSATTSGTNVSTYATEGNDWSTYAGRDWTFTADIYITAAQLANTNVNDDTISWQLLDGTDVLASGGNLTLANASWWTADAWNTVIWKGTFPAASASLANATFAFVNNDKDTHDAGSNYTLDNLSLVCNIPVYDAVLWDDQAPVNGNMMLGATTETAVTGSDTGHGDIGEYNSATHTGQWGNYNSGSDNWEQYAGVEWQLSVDIYITSAQLADPAVLDDTMYYSVAGNAGGYSEVSNLNFVADSWNTVTWFGIMPINPNDLTSASAQVLFNDKATHPAGANLYMDNFKFETQAVPGLPMDTLWNDPNPEGGAMAFTLVTNAFGTGIGEFASDGLGRYVNYGSYNNDWSAYAGQTYTFSFEMYVASAQAGDTNVTDDGLFFQIDGASSGYTSVGDQMIADEWVTVTHSSVFTNEPSALTNSYIRLINNHQDTHPASGPNYYARNFKIEAVAPAEVDDADDLWVDVAPEDGGMMLASISDPFATEQGEIGMFKSADLTGGDISSYGVSNRYWALYAGQDWALTFDIYVSSIQLADANVADDTISYSVAGVAGGSKAISTLVPDEWNTITWTGTFDSDAEALTAVEALLINDDNGTDPVSGPNYFIDNIRLRSVPGVVVVPPDYVTVTNEIEFIAGENYVNGAINGQNSWVAGGSWLVDTASGGTVTCTNNNINMTLLKDIPLPVGDSIEFAVRYKVLGTHVPAGFVYLARIGLTTKTDGTDVGYDGSATRENRAMATLQAQNNANTLRVYGDGWNGPQTGWTALTDGDEWEIRYNLTMGDSAASTVFSVALTNLTSGVGGAYSTPESGVSEIFYSALENGAAYPYFETGGFGSGLTGIEVMSLELIAPQAVVSGYASWVASYGLVGEHGDADADLDGDGMNNLGEYAFGGDPMPGTGAGDIGVIPTYDGSDYTFSVIGDDTLTVNVMTNVNLAVESLWGVHETVPVSNNGVLEEYISNIGQSADNVFIRLEVTK
ncbi:hypothetical protein [Pontiella agarivorans]|uniref:Uncharacterized protein n=1 Tax=Pontiella agarivorans TaxID=3038953 RepID=A0ABU5MUI3_9BACT|nr:hypothetical protein [Pontiella agarivorans]MDZ8117793.1 hypothetical protein [Pontiella agarivorans]